MYFNFRKFQIITILMIFCYLPIKAQNSIISISSINMGYAQPESLDTKVESVIGQIFVGMTETGNSHITSGFLVSNHSITTDLETDEKMLPREFSLGQNYPNPFNPSTTIEFSLPKANKVKFLIYNLLGQLVETVINKYMPSGIHKIEISAKNLSSGVYVYVIETDEFRDFKKMILLK